MKTSRRALAKAFLKLSATHSHAHAVRCLAAVMVSEQRTREVDLIIKEIAQELFLTTGELHATITTAHPISAALKKAIASLVKEKAQAKSVHAEYAIDPALIGGFIATSPQGEINASVTHQLSTLNQLA